MIAKKVVFGLLVLAAWFGVIPQALSFAAGSVAWQLTLSPLPTNFARGTTGTTGVSGPMYRLLATNIGGGPSNGVVTLRATLPTGLTPLGAEGDTSPSAPGPVNPTCDIAGQVVTCVVEEPTYPGRWIGARIAVAVSGSLTPGDVLDATATVGGGGGATVSTTYPTEINSDPPPFGFLSGGTGLSTFITNADGSAATVAGSHPDQLTVNVGFPIDEPVSGTLTGAGQPRAVVTELPRGLIANPNATPVRCTEAELTSVAGCPDASQVGMITAMTTEGGLPALPLTSLYNMVPPPGMPGELAFDALNASIFVHLEGSVRSDGDFGLSARTDDIIARTLNPVMSVQAQIWGNPSGESHDRTRGKCRQSFTQLCPVGRQNAPFLTMPSACSGPLTTTVQVESWEEPGIFHQRSAQTTDVLGNPVGVNGCSGLEFEPTLTLRPDADTASTPTGIHVELRVPQNEELENAAGEPQRATSNVKDTKVVLPVGMAVNPAAASGLEACTSSQIGLRTGVGETPIHFTDDRPRCPEGSRVGTVEVNTPLLDHSVSGSVFVAAPYDNPFGTLLGVYVVVDDPDDGVVIKLAGKTEANPVTGQLTTTFEEAPELPFESFKVDFFNGPRSVLRTPSTCGTFTTRSSQTPWSGTAAVQTADSFAINGGANGGPCASSEAQMPIRPGFEAGTVTPLAASYSPFAGRLSRDDGTQQLRDLEVSLPPGLTGKLAGIETCSDGAIAMAATRTGRQELAGPSCPAGSEIGEVKVGAGAGPTPYYSTGKIYLAGPYQGAPFSAAVITPAVAGPFDLGTVVVRSPTYVDPRTAQVTFRSSDFPHILQGIPLELRDARLSLARPSFILNPSSCAEMGMPGKVTSLLGSVVPISERFQVGGCRGLDYAPKLSIRLKGGTGRGAHPRLQAILTAKPGEEANTARASVALPRSEFLENAHIQTVCTRVQFAAKQCPAGSIYGHARAITPLLDEPLEGPVYLRSSSHELPDMVAALHGPPSRPIEVELDGRIDSVRGGIRSTFDFVPDQPVSKFILTMKGGAKGLIVNSRNLCERTYRATAKFDGQNGKVHDFNPKLKVSCAKKKSGHRRGR